MFKPYQLREHQKVMYKEAHSHNVRVKKEADGGRATNKGRRHTVVHQSCLEQDVCSIYWWEAT